MDAMFSTNMCIQTITKQFVDNLDFQISKVIIRSWKTFEIKDEIFVKTIFDQRKLFHLANDLERSTYLNKLIYILLRKI